MKLQQLEINNVASFPHTTLDFSAEPLASAEVFLVSGPVGSGKSTVLDAIALALYGRTPRLGGPSRSRRGVDNTFNKKAANDVHQILRLGTRSGSVTLTFEADGCAYKACWTVPSTHKRARTLTNLTTGNVFEVADAVDAEVQRIVGLDFDQFCRTVMLAQGDFSNFLKSDEDQKAEILEKIIGATSYRRIGMSIYNCFKNADSAWNDAMRQLSFVDILADEKRRELEGQTHDLTAQKTAAEAQASEIDGQITWIDRYVTLGKSLAGARERLKAAEARLNSEEVADARRNVEQYELTAPARADLAEASRRQKEAADAQTILSELRGDCSVLTGRMRALKNAVDEAAGNVAELSAQVQSREKFKSLYDACGAIKANVDISIAQRRLADSKTKAANELEQKIAQTSQPAADAAAKHRDECGAALDNARKAVADRRRELDAAGLPDLRSKLKVLNVRQTVLTRVETLFANRGTLSQNLGRQQEKIKSNQETAQKCLEAIPAAEEKLAEGRRQLDEVEHTRDIQKQALGDTAAALRAMLRAGDSCPVCGHHIEDGDEALTGPGSDGIKKALEAIEAQVQVNRDRVNGMLEQLTTLKNNRKAAEKAVAEARTESAELTQSLAECTTRLTEAWQEIFPDAPFAEEALKDAQQKTVADITALNGKISAAETIENDVRRLTDAATVAREACDKAVTAADKAKNALDTARKGVSDRRLEAENAMNTSKKALDDALQAVADNNGDADEAAKAPADYAARLEESRESFRNLTVNLADQEKRHYALKNILTQADKGFAELCGCLSVNSADIETAAVRDHRFDKLAGAITDALLKASAARTTVSDAMTAAKEARQRIDSFLAENREISAEALEHLARLKATEVAKLRIAVDAAKTEEAAARGAVSQYAGDADGMLDSKPEIVEEATDPTALVELLAVRKAEATAVRERQSALTAEIAGIVKQLETDDANRLKSAGLRAEADDLAEKRAQWKALNDLFGDATGRKFRRIALSYILSSLIEKANGYMATLTSRYRLDLAPGTFVILVTDAYQSYRQRPVSTISGGETFIVSLAMALALSDVGNVSGADILFIDEGFGTLSGEELQSAIATLRNLRSHTRRRVAVISHIPEVAENIPVQVQVVKSPQSATSALRVIG